MIRKPSAHILRKPTYRGERNKTNVITSLSSPLKGGLRGAYK